MAAVICAASHARYKQDRDSLPINRLQVLAFSAASEHEEASHDMVAPDKEIVRTLDRGRSAALRVHHSILTGHLVVERVIFRHSDRTEIYRILRGEGVNLG